MMEGTCGIKYKFLETPLGKIEISGCEAGVHRIRLLEKMIQRPEGDSHGVSVSSEGLKDAREITTPLDKCTAWLEAYFYRPEMINDLPLPAFHHPIFQKDSFSRQVLYKLMTAVRFGDTISYQGLASLVGKSQAARAVGGIMRHNPVPIIVPCHRVICSTGKIGNYSGGGAAVKEWLLGHEKRLESKWAN